MCAVLLAFFPPQMYWMHYFPLRIHIVMREFCCIREYDTLLTFYYSLLHLPHSVALNILCDHKYELWIGWGRAFVGTLTIEFKKKATDDAHHRSNLNSQQITIVGLVDTIRRLSDV